MGMNILLLCIGITLCFGGIYFRKLFSAILGLIWGAILGFVVALVMALSSGSLYYTMSRLDDSSSVLIIIIAAIVIGLLSAWLDRVCAAVNAFLSSAFTVILIACVVLEDIDDLPIALLIALLIALIIAVLSFKYYDYAFVLITAFSGAFIAGIGVTGLLNNIEPSETLYRVLFYEDSALFGMIAVVALVLGIAGCAVQMHHLRGPAVGGAVFSSGARGSASINTTINALVGFISARGKQRGQTALGSQTVKSLEQLRKEGRKNSFGEAILQDKLLYIAPLLSFLVIPVITSCLLSSGNITWAIDRGITWLSAITTGASLATLVFMVLVRDIKANATFQILWILGFLFRFFDGLKYSHNLWELVTLALRMLAIAAALYFLSRLITRDEIKPLLLALVAVFLYCYVCDWITYFYFLFHVSEYKVVLTLSLIATTYFLFSKSYGINIFQLHRTVSNNMSKRSK